MKFQRGRRVFPASHSPGGQGGSRVTPRAYASLPWLSLHRKGVVPFCTLSRPRPNQLSGTCTARWGWGGQTSYQDDQARECFNLPFRGQFIRTEPAVKPLAMFPTFIFNWLCSFTFVRSCLSYLKMITRILWQTSWGIPSETLIFLLPCLVFCFSPKSKSFLGPVPAAWNHPLNFYSLLGFWSLIF